MKKKLLSLLMALAMMLSLLPTWAIADGEETEPVDGPVMEQQLPEEDEELPEEEEEPSEEEQLPEEDEELPEEDEELPAEEEPPLLATAEPEEETYVAQIGDVTYATLADAVAVVPTNGTATIMMLEDYNHDAIVAFGSGKNITLDLGGKTLSGEALQVKNANLTVTNGTIKPSKGKYGFTVYGNYDPTTFATTKTDSILTIGEDCVLDVKDLSAGTPGVYIVGNGAVLNIYGTITGNTTGTYRTVAIQGNGTVNDTKNYGGTEINIYDGAEILVGKTALFLPQKGTLNVYGGTISGYAGIGMKSGLLNIFGGSVVGTADDIELYDSNSNNNGIAADGSAIVIDSNTAYVGQMEINITGGTVKGNFAYAIHEIGKDNSQNIVSLKISGGQVLGGATASNQSMVIREKTKADGVVSISGGTFSSDVSDYVADGYNVVEDESTNTWTVEAATPVAKIGSTGYPTLKAAIEAAVSNDTVELLEDCNESIDLTLAASVTLDGGNNTMTGKLTLRGNGTNDLVVKNFDKSVYGIAATGFNKVTMSGNTVNSDGGDNGLGLTENKQDAITVNDSNVVEITNNTVTYSNRVGIVCYNIKNSATITGNTVEDTDHNSAQVVYGKGYSECETAVITGNVFKNWGTDSSTATDKGGRALRAQVIDLTFTDNVMIHTNAPEEFVKVTGATTVDVSANYWNGADPTTETTGKGLDYYYNYATDQPTLTSYYTDAEKKDLAIIGAKVAEVNGTEYPTLAKAIEAATAGQTVKLLENVDLTSTGLRVEKKNITLDLNGHSVKVGEHSNNNILVTDATLTLEDNAANSTGKIYTDEVWANDADNGVIRVTDGAFVMNSGKIEAVMTNAEGDGQFAVVMGKDCTVTINGGEIKAGWYAISGNGNRSGNTVVVTGGTLQSTADYAIYSPAANSTVSVSGGTIYGAGGGIFMNDGTLTVTDGTITSKGQGSTGTWGDGTGNANKAAINIKAKYGEASATISGGRIIAENEALVVDTGAQGSISISGGTFSSDVREYCADGYGCVAQGDVYVVGKTQVVTEITEVDAANDDEIEVTIGTGAATTGIVNVAEGPAKEKVVEVIAAVTSNTLVTSYVTNVEAAVGAGATLEIKPTAVKVETVSEEVKVTSLSFDVTPKDKDNNAQHTLSKAVTFVLPVPAEWANTQVKVLHKGVPMGLYSVKGSGDTCYVELESDSFSVYTLETATEADLKDCVARVGDKYYTELQDAIDDAVSSDQVLVLLRNAFFDVCEIPSDGVLQICCGGFEAIGVTALGDEGVDYVLVDYSGKTATLTAEVTSTDRDDTTTDVVEVYGGSNPDALTVSFTLSGDPCYGADIKVSVDPNFEPVKKENGNFDLPIGWKYYPNTNTLNYVNIGNIGTEIATYLGTISFALKTGATAPTEAFYLVTISVAKAAMNPYGAGIADDLTVNQAKKIEIYNKQFTDTTVSAQSHTYDGTAHAFVVTVAGEAGDTVPLTIKYREGTTGDYTLNAAPECTNVADGPKTVYYQVSAPGYETITDEGTLTITKATLSDNKFTVTQAANWIYDGSTRDLVTVEQVVSLAGNPTVTKTFTINGEAAESVAVSGELGKTTTYQVEVTIAAGDNYEAFTSGKMEVVVTRLAYTVYVGSAFAVGSNFGNLVLVFTDSDAVFKYTGVPTYDVTAMGYKYTENDAGTVTLNGTTPAKHVYAFLIQGKYDETQLGIGNVPKKDVVYAAKDMKDGHEKQYDVNISRTVDVNDAVMAQSILNGNPDYAKEMDSYYSRVIRADVNKDGVVNIFDTAAIKLHYDPEDEE